MAVVDHRKTRFISAIAATVIALACGTNVRIRSALRLDAYLCQYVYSAWAPQFAQRLKLSSTETNLVGTMGNLGMYATGIPSGMLVDARGPRWGVAIGTICFAGGYYPIAKAFDAGPGMYSIASLCLFSFLTGAGSCSAFTASIKAAAVNFPDHRGTATAFPLAAFGLSAFFFATIALALPHDESYFLLLLATGTVVLPAVSFFFLHTPPIGGQYEQLPQHESQRLHRTRSTDDRAQISGSSTGTPNKQASSTIQASVVTPYADSDSPEGDSEASSLLSTPPSPTNPDGKSTDASADASPPDLDIRGMKLLPHKEFWLLFGLLALMCGIGLMTINNIGNMAQALWLFYDPDTPGSYIAQRQVLHVSILSFMSFSGRLTSGIGSDVLVKRYSMSRFWCLFAASIIFVLAQISALSITNPPLLVLVSGLSGFGYGMLFGVYPSLVAHTFGVHGLSQNWGVMTLAPVISGNIFNLVYGSIYDAHSVVDDKTGDRECLQGRTCYQGAFWMTLTSSIGAVLLCLYSIWHDNMSIKKRSQKSRRKSHASTID